MSNETTCFGNGSMVWTIIYREENGDYHSKLVYGSPNTPTMLEDVQEEYPRLVALLPGNQRVHFPSENS